MDISTLKVGDMVRTSDGSMCKVGDLSRLPKCVGVAGSYPKHPVIWWPAACVSSRKSAERSAKIAANEVTTRAELLSPVPPPLPIPRPRALTVAEPAVAAEGVDAADTWVEEEVESA